MEIGSICYGQGRKMICLDYVTAEMEKAKYLELAKAMFTFDTDEMTSGLVQGAIKKASALCVAQALYDLDRKDRSTWV